ncbi:MAG: hypothetical protein LBI96_03780 [Odoribacteraceae bacterium]|nr:hypothetical protein [Odoribacteraceae bacterium]
MSIFNVFLVAAVSAVVNFFLGRWRRGCRKFTLKWWILIHASIPLIIPLRLWLGTPLVFVPLFIGLAVVGQLAGSRWRGGGKGDGGFFVSGE